MKLGTTELLIILAIIIVIFGPSQIPKLSKMLGKAKKSYSEGAEEAASEAKATESKSDTVE
ncbi:MAG: twin-arginine translocase TatA/TatE family subunit [Lachnospiraceae bacterium]|nr:twin-arginine translocase TatA/TatE family subunit [Lachnospiraceae bacterium]